MSESMIASESRFESVRGLRYHLRCWGPPDAPPVLLLHGWMDTSASFQFLVDGMGAMDAAGSSWRFLCPDWRGFGLSEWSADGSYVYQDYIADLDALLGALGLAGPVPLLGHSLGGNIACLYAAARPERVRCVITLDGFGLRAHQPGEAPVALRRWLDELALPPRRRSYPRLEDIVDRVRELSDRLSPERAHFIAAHWAEQAANGEWLLRADPGHRRSSPHLYRLDEAMACWAAVEAPVLWLEAPGSENFRRHGLTPNSLAERRRTFARLELHQLSGTGHMMHWECPEDLAARIAPFLARHAALGTMPE